MACQRLPSSYDDGAADATTGLAGDEGPSIGPW